MADIRAFHAMRYTKPAGEAKELTCPPYDIISEAERAAFSMMKQPWVKGEEA